MANTFESVQPQIFKQVDAARFFGVSDRTVRNWISSGRLKKMNMPGCWISRAEIERFIQSYGSAAA